MITSVPNDLICGDANVAFWGSFRPVYSPSRNQIYKNIICATADGVTDGLLWDVILNCRVKDDFTGENNFSLDPVVILHLIFEQGSFFYDWNCHINFMIKDINLDGLLMLH